MQIQEILKHCDHMLLAQTATFEEIKVVLDDAIKYKCASACIPPCFVRRAKEYVGAALKICTVIGFPNGYQTTAVKVFETMEAVSDGADEVDMVVNIGDVKAGDYEAVENEIKKIKNICDKRGKEYSRKIILKVIVETCLLTDREKVKLCKIVTNAGADFIKTSTGFSKAGATREDIELFKKHIGEQVKMKAAGGIATLQDAEGFLNLGCERIGTSRIVKIAKDKGV